MRLQAVSGFEETKEQVMEVEQTLRESIEQSTDSVAQSAAQPASQASEAAGAALDSIADQMGSIVDTIGGAAGSAYSDALQSVENAMRGAQDAADSVLSATEQSMSAVGQGITDLTPSPLREGLEAVFSNPVPYIVLLAATLGIPFVYDLLDRYVGYAGPLSAEEAMEELQSVQPALLIDIRTDEERQSSGIPSLKKKALGRGVAVPLLPVSKDLTKRVRDPRKLAVMATAAYTAGLQQGTYATKYIFMGAKDRDEREVAKALASLRYPFAYILEGGYDAWLEAGFPHRTGENAVYESGTTLIAERVTEEVLSLQEPRTLIPLASGGAVLTLAVLNYHFILQLIGVLGSLASLTVYLSQRYEDPAALWAETVSLFDKMGTAVSGLVESARDNLFEEPQLAAPKNFPVESPGAVQSASIPPVTSPSAPHDSEQQGNQAARNEESKSDRPEETGFA